MSGRANCMACTRRERNALFTRISLYVGNAQGTQGQDLAQSFLETLPGFVIVRAMHGGAILERNDLRRPHELLVA